MPEYRVFWVIDLDSTDVMSVAREAMDIMRDRKSSSTVFNVVLEDSPGYKAIGKVMDSDSCATVDPANNLTMHNPWAGKE